MPAKQNCVDHPQDLKPMRNLSSVNFITVPHELSFDYELQNFGKSSQLRGA